jgi:hypothetical protein
VKISFPQPCTGRIAVAWAEIFNMLADAIPDPVPAIGPPSASRISLVMWIRGFSRARRRA